jgi:hypothetical protein
LVNTVILFLFWSFSVYEVFVIGAWVITLQAFQLLMTWVFRKRKGAENVRENQKE